MSNSRLTTAERRSEIEAASASWPTRDLSPEETDQLELYLRGALDETGVEAVDEPTILCDSEGVRLAALLPDGTLRDPNQLELFGTLLTELQAMQKRPNVGESHLVATLSGHLFNGTWEEILLQMKAADQEGSSASLVEFTDVPLSFGVTGFMNAAFGLRLVAFFTAFFAAFFAGFFAAFFAAFFLAAIRTSPRKEVFRTRCFARSSAARSDPKVRDAANRARARINGFPSGELPFPLWEKRPPRRGGVFSPLKTPAKPC